MAASSLPVPLAGVRARARTCASASESSSSSSSSSRARVGFSFSPAGLLFPYPLGVACGLERGGALVRGVTPVVGASAGALVVLCMAVDQEWEAGLAGTMRLAAACRREGTFLKLGRHLRAELEAMVPEDAHARWAPGCEVAVTPVLPRREVLRVSRFASREEVVDALCASCSVPLYSSRTGLERYLETRWCTDGFFHDVANFGTLATPAERTVRVLPFPLESLQRIRFLQGANAGDCISPGSEGAFPFSDPQLSQWALQPATDDAYRRLFHTGVRDGLSWAERTLRDNNDNNNNSDDQGP